MNHTPSERVRIEQPQKIDPEVVIRREHCFRQYPNSPQCAVFSNKTLVSLLHNVSYGFPEAPNFWEVNREINFGAKFLFPCAGRKSFYYRALDSPTNLDQQFAFFFYGGFYAYDDTNQSRKNPPHAIPLYLEPSNCKHQILIKK